MKNKTMTSLDMHKLSSGFLRGLSAPSLLFCDYTAPNIKIVEVNRLYRPAPSIRAALESDIGKIGQDFNSAIEAYEQKA